jgi:curved DNA-binding protein CbpA
VEKRKHRRYIKRLTATLFVDQKSFTGISGDLSESGLFIRTNRSLAVNTPVDIEILLPDNRTSLLKGSVRRTHISPLKTGIGIQITEKDRVFSDFVESIGKVEDDNATGEHGEEPGSHAISRVNCDVEIKQARKPVREKRRHKRFELGNMNVGGEMPASGVVKVINMSMSGALLKADRRLDIGNKYALKLEYKKNVVFAKAVVIWSLLAEGVRDAVGKTRPVYLAGMQFTDVTRGNLEEIVECIESDVREDVIQQAGEMDDMGGAMNIDPCPVMGEDLSEDVIEVRADRDSGSPDRTGTAVSGDIVEEIEVLYGRYIDNTLDYYRILGVEDFAGPEEIQKAYHNRVRKLHPDRHCYLSDPAMEKLNAIFAYLNEAYGILKNPESRKEYDRSQMQGPAILTNKDVARRKFEQGKIAFWDGNLPEAESFFQNAIYLNGSEGKYFYFYAKTLVKLGKYRDAERAIKGALKTEPLNTDYLTEAGNIYDVMGFPQRARKNFDEALRLQPGNIKEHDSMMGSTNNDGGFRANIRGPIRAFKKMIVK